MRDPKRIDAVLEHVRRVWMQHPDMRLAWMLVGKDPFYTEDDVLCDIMKTWVGNVNKWGQR